MWTRFVLTKSIISSSWRSNDKQEMVDSVCTNQVHHSGSWCSSDPQPSPDCSPQLRDKIWEWPEDEAKPHVCNRGCVCLFIWDVSCHTESDLVKPQVAKSVKGIAVWLVVSFPDPPPAVLKGGSGDETMWLVALLWGKYGMSSVSVVEYSFNCSYSLSS